MPNYIISGEDLEVLAQHYKSQLQSLIPEYEKLGYKIKEIEKKLESLDTPSLYVPAVTPLNGYVNSWSWNQKIKYVLQKSGKLSRAGIISEILKREPSLSEDGIANSIGATLSTTVIKETSDYTREESDKGWVYYLKK